MYGALDISTGGMIAQRTRLESIMTNIAHRETILDENGQNNPFQRRVVFFAPGDPSATTPEARRMGVHVASIEKEEGFDLRHEPSSPYADANGHVKYPAINSVFEQMNAFEAQRAYEANVVAAEASKTMMAQALRLIA